MSEQSDLVWTLDGLGRNTLSLVFMQRQWPAFQQVAKIPTNTRNEWWKVFLWAVGNPYTIHVADMLICPQASHQGSRIPQQEEPGQLKSPSEA